MFKSPHKIVLLLLILFATGLSVLLLLNPAAIYPDAAWGFQVLRSMRAGSGFNIINYVSQQNIADNWSEFKSWWSPGQYLLPAAFTKLFNISVGKGASLTTIFCQFSGLAGLYCFFNKAGFNKTISALSILVIALQQAFFVPYIFYNGGEVLLFGFVGWFLYGCIAFEKTDVRLLLFVLLSGWIGFFCKSSFVWIYGAGLCCLWIRLTNNSRTLKKWLLNALWIGIPAAISMAVIYFSYISKGMNPSSQSAGLDFSWKVLAFPLASPLLSGLSFDDLANGLIFHNDDAIFSAGQAMLIVTLLVILSVGLVFAIYKRSPGPAYTLMLIVCYIAAILFFGSAFLRRLDISYESRHFRVIGLIITPGLLYVFGQLRAPYRYALMVVISVVAFFSLRYYVLSYIGLKTETAHGPSGIAQQFVDQPSLDYLELLDHKSKNAIFVLFSPDLGLEIENNRIITLDPLNAAISINTDDYIHKGHSGPLYILMPHEYIGIRASVILKSFPGYKAFSLKELSDDYVLYFATQAR